MPVKSFISDVILQEPLVIQIYSTQSLCMKKYGVFLNSYNQILVMSLALVMAVSVVEVTASFLLSRSDDHSKY